jgi:hypothetical protein
MKGRPPMADKSPKVETPPAPWAEWMKGLTSYTDQSRRAFARVAIDGIETTVDNAIQFERRIAEVIPLDWVREAIVVRTTVADEVKAAWVKAARAAVA